MSRRSALIRGCSIPRPSRGAARSIGPHLAFAPQLLQDEPDRLVADAWHCRPDVGEAEGGGHVAQDVLADTFLLRPRRPGPRPQSAKTA
jgi:hypothetical protein